jgi:hypothetical protein
LLGEYLSLPVPFYFHAWFNPTRYQKVCRTYCTHANIHHTVRYTQLAPHWFDGFWDD